MLHPTLNTGRGSRFRARGAVDAATRGAALGASGGVETVLAVLATERRVVPPSVGTEQVDPDLPACRIALGTERSYDGAALLLAESFGGRCAALVLQAA